MTGHDCAICGAPTEDHDRHVRFRVPDPVLDLPGSETTPGTWLSEPDANKAVMMQVPGAGAFIRALLPVRLTGGYTVTYGVWVGVHPNDLQRAFKDWWSPDYAALTFSGRLANAVHPWGMLASPVELVVRDPDQTPYCAASSDPTLTAVLTTEWDHDLVLSALPPR